MKTIVEICCGSYYDALQAKRGGADRIELNSALHLGGLTPSLATLQLLKEETDLEIAAMVRVRGAGFCYAKEDFKVMAAECDMMMKNGADSVVFGCLTLDRNIDIEKSKNLIDLIKGHGGEAVFHRAFDCVKEPYKAMETLIEIGVDRVLTSGLKPKAMDGAELLKQLQHRYGTDIQILAGSGVNSGNARQLMELTGVRQIHSSCKAWLEDSTTNGDGVSFSYRSSPYESCYEAVSGKMVKELIDTIKAQ